MRIFLSAHHSARPHALPGLIAGFITEVPEGSTEVGVLALRSHEVTVAGTDLVEDKEIWLTGRPTHRLYAGLPWWEARLDA